MAWLLLIPAGLACAASVLLSFRRELVDRWWLTPAFVLLSVVNGLLWAWAVRLSANDRQTYLLSLAWDVVVIGSWVLIPILTGQVKPTAGLWCGVGLMLVGITVAKVSS